VKGEFKTNMNLRFDAPGSNGEWITRDQSGNMQIPDRPIVGFIEGDGVGPDITSASRTVFDAAVRRAYSGKKEICWWEIPAGEKSHEMYGEYLMDDALKAIVKANIVIKGPLTTPVGGGYRSINVTLRQKLNLYACVRPVRHIGGAPAPVKRPQDVNMVIFRENMEDLYKGIEWRSGSEEAEKIIDFLEKDMGVEIDKESGIGIKPISPKATKKLVTMAIQYALDNDRKTVTLIHKGNIMKFTEGAFRDWGYEAAVEEFRDKVVLEEELWNEHSGKMPQDKILINDRIADAAFQQVLLRPKEYEVLATPNLNGDYMSDALAAQVGGLGMAPGANIGDECAVFEATHGSAPKYAGMDKVNPGSLILSGVMMLEYMGWPEAGDLIVKAMSKTIESGVVTYDLARQLPEARETSCSGFASEIVENMAKI
jgi:isocitrate dehydrogenase